MNIRMIAQILGRVLLIMAALLLLPFVTGLVYAENILPFAVTIAGPSWEYIWVVLPLKDADAPSSTTAPPLPEIS